MKDVVSLALGSENSQAFLIDNSRKESVNTTYRAIGVEQPRIYGVWKRYISKENAEIY
jgi:hypothetical protein